MGSFRYSQYNNLHNGGLSGNSHLFAFILSAGKRRMGQTNRKFLCLFGKTDNYVAGDPFYDISATGYGLLPGNLCRMQLWNEPGDGSDCVSFGGGVEQCICLLRKKSCFISIALNENLIFIVDFSVFRPLPLKLLEELTKVRKRNLDQELLKTLTA